MEKRGVRLDKIKNEDAFRILHMGEFKSSLPSSELMMCSEDLYSLFQQMAKLFGEKEGD